MLPEVIEAMAVCMHRGYANPASQHSAGRRARQAINDARETIAKILAVDLVTRKADRLVFTSGGTEANNLAVFGLAHATGNEPGEAITSTIEHPSINGPIAQLEQRGWMVHRVGVTREGIVKVDQFEALISNRTRFATIMLANNETGVLQPIEQLARIANERGVPLHTDAAQYVGKLPVDFRELGVAAMSMAAHKFHGPSGIGALALRHDVTIAPQLYGGFQQSGLRPGSEPVALAVGMCRALELFQEDHPQRVRGMRELLNQFESSLKQGFPNVVVNGAGASRLPNTSNLAFLGLDRQALVMALDLAGICCSTGSACASGSSEPSPVLLAMDCPREVVTSSLRFSLGAETTAEDIDEAVRRILTTTANLARSTRGDRAGAVMIG
jgi:cysteine desulfurase